jgi:hypothetical protein
MNKLCLKRFVRLLVFFLFMSFGLCGTSFGTAFFLVGSRTGFILFGLGAFLLFAALYMSWIQPRHRPVDPE